METEIAKSNNKFNIRNKKWGKYKIHELCILKATDLTQ